VRHTFFKTHFDGFSLALRKWLRHVWIFQPSKRGRTRSLGCRSQKSEKGVVKQK
jgi:hypothetical protein